MPTNKIKAEWSAVRITADQAVIVYTRLKNKVKSLFFEDIQAFQKAFRQKEISVRRWIVSVPDDLCIQKRLELPAQSLDEAVQMVEFELVSLLPIPPEQRVYGCLPVSQQEHLYEISVHILRSDLLDQALDPYQQIGIRPAKVIPDSVAYFSAIPTPGDEGAILLYLDNSKYRLSTAVKGCIQSVTDLDILDINTQEARKELFNSLFHKEQELQAITNTVGITLVTNSENADKLTAFLKNSGIRSPITVVSCLTLLPDNKTLPFYEGLLALGAFETINNDQYEHLNLLPASQLNRAKQQQKLKRAALITSLSIIVLLLLWANLFVWNWRTKRACRKVQKLIAPIEHIATDVEQKKQLVRALQNQLSTGRDISAVFQELYQFSPDAVTICDLQYKQKSSRTLLSLKGQTDTLPQAFDYSEAMKKSQLLKQIQINDVQQSPTPGGSIVEFKAECVLQDRQ
jgi:hypothetical protein